MQKYLFKNISVVNEGTIFISDVFIEKGRIKKLGRDITIKGNVVEINGEGRHLLPGIMDDQVHFREPGLTHKGTIYSDYMMCPTCKEFLGEEEEKCETCDGNGEVQQDGI